MRKYKIFRWFLRASALTTVMFVMQACYGSPNMPPEMLDEVIMTEESDTLVSADLSSADDEYEDLQSGTNEEAD